MSLNTLTPLQQLPTRDRAAAALREAILSHQFQEGQELTLKDTAALLGVSATPIREAFQILEREGLIALRPNRGAVVLGMNEKRLRDHYETRAVLERAAAEAACRRSAPLDGVRSAYAQAEAALARNDSHLYSEQNEAFHVAIWTAGGNDKIRELLSGLWNGLSMGHKVTQEHYAQISMAEHAGILQALEARDAPRAGQLMEAHILRSLQNVLTHLDAE